MGSFLMCAPVHYGVQYEINPWMNVDNQPIHKKAAIEWRSLFRRLKSLGQKIEFVSPEPGLPDMVFTANAGLIKGNKAVLSNFRFPVRQLEARHFFKWFKQHHLEIISLPKGLFFEGEGDALFWGEDLICAYRFRSDLRSHLILSEFFNVRTLSLELINPAFYHLDTCFCPLDKDTALYYPGAFDTYGIAALNELGDLIAVTKEDAENFCCNAVVLGKHLILNNCSDHLAEELRQRGFTLWFESTTEFIKAGGAAKCMVLYLS